MKALTEREALMLMKAHWTAIATFNLNKGDAMPRGFHGYVSGDCFACEFHTHQEENRCGKNCMVKWTDDRCLSRESEFTAWEEALKEDKPEMAWKIVQLAEDALALLPPDKFIVTRDNLKELRGLECAVDIGNNEIVQCFLADVDIEKGFTFMGQPKSKDRDIPVWCYTVRADYRKPLETQYNEVVSLLQGVVDTGTDCATDCAIADVNGMMDACAFN